MHERQQQGGSRAAAGLDPSLSAPRVTFPAHLPHWCSTVPPNGVSPLPCACHDVLLCFAPCHVQPADREIVHSQNFNRCEQSGGGGCCARLRSPALLSCLGCHARMRRSWVATPPAPLADAAAMGRLSAFQPSWRLHPRRFPKTRPFCCCIPDFSTDLTPFRAEWDPKDPSERLIVCGR